jgi:hypothetical protein
MFGSHNKTAAGRLSTNVEQYASIKTVLESGLTEALNDK